jgi:hypothetical protein
MYKKNDKTDCSNYRGKLSLPTTYKILSNILLSRLTPYTGEITGNHECGFRRNRASTDHIFFIRKILEKKWGKRGSSASALYRFQESLGLS